MAKNEVTIKIKLEGGNLVVKATDQTRKLRTEIDKTSKAQDRASKSATGLQRTQERGVYQTSNNARNFSKLSQTIGRGDNGLVGAYATLAANTFAVTAAFAALQRASQAGKVMAGLEAQGARLGMTLSLTAQRIREVTNDAVSMADAMRSTAQLTAAGFNGDQIAELSAVAKDAAGALGRDLGDSLDRLTRGVTKLEPELLDEIGLMTKLDEASRRYAIANNKSAESLTAAEKRQAFMNSVLAEGERKFGGVGEQVGEFDAFTRLAATSVDAFNTVIGAAAQLLSPFVELFASNEWLIVGAVVLYASTIRNSLVPALGKAGEAQKEFLEASRETAREIADDFQTSIGALNKIPKFDQDEGGFAAGARSGSIVKELLADMEEGTLTTSRYKGALASLDEDLGSLNNRLKNTVQGTQKYNDLLGDKQTVMEARESVLGLADAQFQSAAKGHELEAVTAASNASLTNLGATAKTIVKSMKGQFAALNQGITVTRFNVNGLTASLTTMGLRGVAAFRAIAGAAKAAGIAILNMLPIIGQIILLLGLAWEGLKALYEFLRSDEQRAYNEALEEYATIQEALNEKVREYVRIQSLAATSGSAQLDQIRLQGNGITELATAFDDLEKARAAAQGTGTTWIPGLGDPTNNAEAIETLEGISKLLTGAQKERVLAIIEEGEAISDQAERYEFFKEQISTTARAYADLAFNSENLRESFDNLETSSTQFIQSAAMSTPYDRLVEDTESATFAIQDLRRSFADGAIEADDFGNALTVIGTNSASLAGPEAVAALRRVQELRGQIEADSFDSAVEELNVRQQLVAAEQQFGTVLEAGLAASQERLHNAQELVRLTKQQIAFEKARFNAVSSLTQVGASGFTAQQKAAETQVALQNRLIQSQLEILEIRRASQQITLDTLNAEIERLENSRNLTEEEERRLDIAKQNRTRAELAEREIEATIANQQNQIATNNIGLLNDAEKAAGRYAASLELINDQLNTYESYLGAVDSFNREVAQYNRVITGTNTDIIRGLDDINRNYRESLRNLELEERQLENNYSAQRARLVATQTSRQLNAEEAAAAAESIRVLDESYQVDQARLDVLRNTIDLERQREAIELAIYDNRKEGLEWQKEALGYLQKEVELNEKIRDARNDINDSRRRVRNLRGGIIDTEQGQRNDAVREATRALESAQRQASIRMSIIQAEYALMDAQKTALQVELISRMQLLRALGVSEDFLAPVQQAVQILDNIDVGNLRDLALEGVRVEVEVAKQNVVEAIAEATTRSRPDEGSIGAVMRSNAEARREMGEVVADAQGPLAAKIAEPIDVLIGTTNTGLAQMSEAVMNAPNPTVEGIGETNTILLRIETLLGGSGTGGVSGANDFSQYRQTGFFGETRRARGGGTRAHAGNDYAMAEGTPIYARTSGTIGRAGTARGYGQVIDLIGEEFSDRMAHLSRIVVTEGQQVMAGQLLGYSGNTGVSTGPHLHLETRVNGQLVDPNSVTQIPIQLSSETTTAGSTPLTEATDLEVTAEGLKTVQMAANEAALSVEKYDEAIVVSASRDETSVWERRKEDIAEYTQVFNESMLPLQRLAEQMGPDGEMILAITEGINQMSIGMQSIFTDLASMEKMSFESFTSIAGAMTQVISGIASITNAASQQRIRQIDAEIAAEQKRDGQSVASQKKIEELEKKKDRIARKQFNTNKKLMMANAVIGTAAGISNALGSLPVPANIIMAGIIGAMGAAQLAIISGTSYQSANDSGGNTAETAKLSVGRIGSSVNLDRPNPNAGGEIGYLRGSGGYGTNSSNYSTIGSAYGGSTSRGYGSRQFLVGEKGPEFIEAPMPMMVKPKTEAQNSSGDTFIIQATDAESFDNMLRNNPEAIAEGLRKLANSSGEGFLENVDLNSYRGTRR